MDHLELAREELGRASEQAGGPVQTQLDSLQNGIGAEDDRETHGDGPDSTVDRIAEVADKLDGLEEEVESTETQAYIDSAVDHLREYLTEHPHGK